VSDSGRDSEAESSQAGQSRAGDTGDGQGEGGEPVHQTTNMSAENTITPVEAATHGRAGRSHTVSVSASREEFLPRAALMTRLKHLEDDLTRRMRREELLMFQQAKLKKRNTELRQTNTILTGELGVLKEELRLMLEKRREEFRTQHRLLPEE